ncbi:hypothetical protein ACLF5H_27415, partial [Streptomyces sp. LaBMicrA B280]
CHPRARAGGTRPAATPSGAAGSTDDARQVIGMPAPLGVGLVELSGGSYESPAMSGRPADARAQAREAYFLDLAKELVTTSPLPLMLTVGAGGGATRPTHGCGR